MFPCAELPEHSVVGQLRIIRRKRDKAAARDAQLLRQFCVEADREQRTDEIVKRFHARTEHHQWFSIFPCHYGVVWSHPTRNVVASQCGRSCPAFLSAAIRWHYINLPVPSV